MERRLKGGASVTGTLELYDSCAVASTVVLEVIIRGTGVCRCSGTDEHKRIGDSPRVFYEDYLGLVQ